jgi:serine/threonine protein kinase
MMEMEIKCGTDPYMAPEFFKNKVVYDEKVDVYALAVNLFRMLEGFLPDVNA